MKVPEFNETDEKYIKAAYWAMVDLIDAQVGRLLSFLEEKDLIDNTIIIFMSDHGELLGDHGMYYKGPHFYEPAVHVPLIISCPSLLNKNQKSEALVELVDLAPTLLEAAGLDIPEGVQGKSFLDVMTSEDADKKHRDDVYCEYYNSLPWNKPGVHATMVATHRYKLICYHGVDSGELYDLEKDPDERDNLWNDSQYKDVKVDMFKRLSDRMAWTVDPLPPRQAPF